MASTKTLSKKNKKSSTKGAAKAKAKKAKKAKKKAAAPTGAITRASRVILYVSDFDRALAFYSQTLGLELSYPAEHGWGEFKTGAAAVCIHSGRAGEMTTKGITSLGLAVDDFDAALARLSERGVVMSAPFSPCGDLRVSHFCDPDGNELSIEGK